MVMVAAVLDDVFVDVIVIAMMTPNDNVVVVAMVIAFHMLVMTPRAVTVIVVLSRGSDRSQAQAGQCGQGEKAFHGRSVRE